MNFLRKLHKWLGLLIGIQVVLWTVSGLMFAWLDHHEVMAEHSVHPPQPAVLGGGPAMAEPAVWLDEYAGRDIYEIRLVALLDQWLWRVETADSVELRGSDGGRFALDETLVTRMAREHYQGTGELLSVVFQPEPGLETRGAGAVWQATFDDSGQTTLYFAAADGRLQATRNSTWRLFDFFWMLHTMDFEGRDNFNNPLVIAAGTGALWLSLSGLLLLTRSFRRRDFEFLRRLRRS
jgi:uncharacterized iron-regulated membrane protein